MYRLQFTSENTALQYRLQKKRRIAFHEKNVEKTGSKERNSTISCAGAMICQLITMVSFKNCHVLSRLCHKAIVLINLKIRWCINFLGHTTYSDKRKGKNSLMISFSKTESFFKSSNQILNFLYFEKRNRPITRPQKKLQTHFFKVQTFNKTKSKGFRPLNKQLQTPPEELVHLIWYSSKDQFLLIKPIRDSSNE